VTKHSTQAAAQFGTADRQRLCLASHQTTFLRDTPAGPTVIAWAQTVDSHAPPAPALSLIAAARQTELFQRNTTTGPSTPPPPTSHRTRLRCSCAIAIFRYYHSSRIHTTAAGRGLDSTPRITVVIARYLATSPPNPTARRHPILIRLHTGLRQRLSPLIRDRGMPQRLHTCDQRNLSVPEALLPLLE
jgi:hypothetical protein